MATIRANAEAQTEFDQELLDLADTAARTRGDGTIDLDDAQRLVWSIKIDDDLSEVERATMAYIRANYEFTVAAESWFKIELRRWAALQPIAAEEATPQKHAEVGLQAFQSFSTNETHGLGKEKFVNQHSGANTKHFLNWLTTGALVVAIVAALGVSAIEQLTSSLELASALGLSLGAALVVGTVLKKKHLS